MRAREPGRSDTTGLPGRIFGVFLVVALAAASGCHTSASDSAPTPSAGPPIGSPSPSSRQSELTADEDLTRHPPPPLDVRAAVVDGHVYLTWQPPAPVRVPHRYSDRVVSYRIYRRGPGELDLRPIGISTTLAYTDRSIPGTGEFGYAVTSVRERDLEGSKSDPAVLVQVP